MSSKPRVIAFYLPQFHPTPENDMWWGKGFTEWTNVGKAKKLFIGHNQPKVPTELGYYDLRLPEVYEQQVEMAKKAGVEGFCFWHYYFGEGRELLDKPLKRIVSDKADDFPFCLGWANESWEKKLWNKDGSGNKTLIEQKYLDEEDYKRHFELVLPALKDDRYIKVDGKPLFLIYRPNSFENCAEFISCWRKLLKEETGMDFHFVAHALVKDKDYSKYFDMGFDAVYSNKVQAGATGLTKSVFKTAKYGFQKIMGLPRIVNFKEVIKCALQDEDRKENMYPGIICGWDHTPRSGKKGYVFTNFTMPLFKEHIESVFDEVKDKSDEHKIVFLKSWNEWGEGNFMEPDMEYGTGKVDTLGKCISDFS